VCLCGGGGRPWELELHSMTDGIRQLTGLQLGLLDLSVVSLSGGGGGRAFMDRAAGVLAQLGLTLQLTPCSPSLAAKQGLVHGTHGMHCMTCCTLYSNRRLSDATPLVTVALCLLGLACLKSDAPGSLPTPPPTPHCCASVR
jgi:hypothetical protein